MAALLSLSVLPQGEESDNSYLALQN